MSIALYHHAGSGNHGCEAIVRGFAEGIAAQSTGASREPLRLITNSADEDLRYLPADMYRVEEERHMNRHLAVHVAYYAWRKVTGDRESFLRYRFPMLIGKNRPSLAVSIGGDNYCYPEMVPDLILADRMLVSRGIRTVLLGCSVEPDSLSGDRAMLEDLKTFSLVTARESRTYEALLAAGIDRERLKLIPDPAFAMEAKNMPLPEGFDADNTVGINVSPLIEQYRGEGGRVLDSFAELIDHILRNTDLQIALIPHVVWASSDDRGPLDKLHARFADTGRVVSVGDHPAPVLKGYIAGCRFFVGARTHATIAAYSSLVPTLVVGYSIKSKGIAGDLFGTDEGLVLPVKDLTGQRLIGAFEDLRSREDELKRILAEVMPGVKARSLDNAAVLFGLAGEKNEG